MTEGKFVSIDWGTSRLRINLCDLQHSTIKAVKDLEMGIKKTFEACSSQQSYDQESFFLNTLLDEIPKDILHLPIVISGMASSSIGIRNVPYASLPFEDDGSDLVFDVLDHSSVKFPIYLISGISSEQDVMRGEEVQLLAFRKNHPTCNIFVFPGTHSKHAFFDNHRLTDFHTYMTGELFSLMREHSILHNSVSQTDPQDFDLGHFRQGVQDSQENLLHHLFQIRGRDLLQNWKKEANYYYLSGLIIGSELRALLPRKEEIIFLGATPALLPLYAEASRTLDLRYQLPTDGEVSSAACIGQKMFLKQQEQKNYDPV